MRHRKKSRRLVGKWEHKRALMRNLLIALFIHERIKTTEAKAKELRRIADKMITLAKRGDLAARRQALSILPNKEVVRKLFSDLRERYLDRESGFTRIVRIGPRRGDAAMMVFIELVTDKLEHKRSPKKAQEVAEALAMAPKKEEAPEAQEVSEAQESATMAEEPSAPEAQASETQGPEEAKSESAEASTPTDSAEASETTGEASTSPEASASESSSESTQDESSAEDTSSKEEKSSS